MYFKGSGLVLLTMIFMLMLLVSVYLLVLMSSCAVIIFLTGVFAGALTLIWYILMVGYISKVPVDNGANHLMWWINYNVSCLYNFKDKFH